MRISFKDRLRPDDLAGYLSDLLEDLASIGVDEIFNVNLYFRMESSQRPVELHQHGGQKVEVLEVHEGQFRTYREARPPRGTRGVSR